MTTSKERPISGVNSLLEGMASHMVSTQLGTDLLFCLWFSETESHVAQAGFNFIAQDDLNTCVLFCFVFAS